MPPELSFKTKDSGRREEWPTGSRRDTREGKGRYDLLPPHAVLRLVQLYERGAAKYGDRNWEKGQPLTRYLDSALRHLFQALASEEDEDHMAAVAWNAFAFMETERRIRAGELPAGLDDLPGREDMGRAVKLIGEVKVIDLPRLRVRVGKPHPDVRDGQPDFDVEYEDTFEALRRLKVGQRVEVLIDIPGAGSGPC